MNNQKIFSESQKRLVLGKEAFDYLGLLYIDSDKLQSFDNKKEELSRILTFSQDITLSRSQEYYNDLTLSEIFAIDERLNDLYHELIKERGKHEHLSFLKTVFSVLEQRINIGLKLYYSHFKEGIDQGKINIKQHNFIKRRLKDDYNALISLMHGEIIELNQEMFRNRISKGFTIEGRMIEMDNKYLLFSRMRDLWLEEEEICKLCSPMLGGIQIPFMLEGTYNFLNKEYDKKITVPEWFHIIYGEHDNIQYGRKIRSEDLNLEEKLCSISPRELISDLEGEKVVIFDDNTGTGETLRNLRGLFTQVFEQVNFGFIEISWKLIDEITNGIRESKHFSINDIKYPTFRNYRHHKVLDNLVIEIVNKDAETYYKKIKSLGFQNGYLSDTECLFNQGYNYARKNNMIFDNPSIEQSTRLSYELETSDTNFILSLDIMENKIRYLEQHDPFEIADLIMNFGIVNIIDIDRHQGKDYNEKLIKLLCSMKECRVGGGVRKPEDIKKLLSLGAYKVIITTCATPELLEEFPKERIVVGIDSIDRISNLPNNVPERMKILAPYASDFQYICVETDGKMEGGDLKRGMKYAKLTDKPYAIVGGITYHHEINLLRDKGIYAVVGRAVFENLFGDKLK